MFQQNLPKTVGGRNDFTRHSDEVISDLFPPKKTVTKIKSDIYLAFLVDGAASNSYVKHVKAYVEEG